MERIMKKIALSFLILLFAMSCEQNSNSEVSNTIEIPGKDEVSKPTDFKQKISFALGLDMGKNFKRDSLDIDFKYFLAGIKYSIVGDSTLLSAAEIKEAMDEFYANLQEKQAVMQQQNEEKMMVEASENIKVSNDFLAENSKKDSVVVTQSGLQYQILQAGTGKKCKEDGFVKANVIGRLLDGTEIENTYKKSTVIIKIQQLVPGWKEAMLMMKEGSRWRIWLPPNLAFGEQGMAPGIPPNAVIEFEIEFISIEDPAEVERMRNEQQQQREQQQQNMQKQPGNVKVK